MRVHKKRLPLYPYYSDEDSDDSPSALAIEMKTYRQQPHKQQTAFNGAGMSPHSSHPISLPDKQRAKAEWMQIANLDRFLEQVYEYYHNKGLYVILLNRIADLCIVGFIVFFFIFLNTCIDYGHLFAPTEHHRSLWDSVHIERFGVLSFYWGCCLLLFAVYWVSQLVSLAADIPELQRVYRFYNHLLEIPDRDLATYALEEVINRIVKVQEENRISVDRLNAHDIANRILRKENYLIALFNKDILNLTLPIPYFRHKKILTKTLEWNVSFCILNYIFDENYAIRKRFTKDVQKDQMALELRKRFVIMGCINLILAPFIIVFLIVYFVFRYGEEFYRSPRNIGMRQYTPYARWKFREFNELPHFFDLRLNRSYRAASRYMGQHSNAMVAVVAKLTAFVIGSIVFVMIILGVLSEELLLNLEITHGRTLIWYLGLFGIVLAVCRSLVPDENAVYDPALLLSQVIESTHYLPSHWRGQLHTEHARLEFAELFDYKIVVFAEELLSVVFTPFLLWWSLPSSAGDIVDFFREFTVHVDGIGYVCSFAIFDFKRHGNPKYGSIVHGATDKYHRSSQGKMEKSFLNFKDNYPTWIPDQDGSFYLDHLRAFHNELVGGGEQREEEEGGGSGSESLPDPICEHLLSSEFKKCSAQREPSAGHSPGQLMANITELVPPRRFGYQSGAMSPISSSKKMDEELDASSPGPVSSRLLSIEPTRTAGRGGSRPGSRPRLDQSSMMASTLRPISSGSILVDSGQWSTPSQLASDHRSQHADLNSPSLIALMNKYYEAKKEGEP